jgi:hypothetical protein
MIEFDIKKTIDRSAELIKRVTELTSHDVLVGIPAEKTARPGEPITNASLGYIHEHGSPARNIPARPFLYPGVRKARVLAQELWRQGALDALHGTGNPMTTLNKIGLVARNSVVAAITDPEPPFVPLKPATIRARLQRTQAGRRKLSKIAKAATAAGTTTAQALSAWAAVPGNIKPLLDTLQLRASISYVVR